MFNIIDGSNLSLQEIINFCNNGGSFIRASHLGNQPIETLFLSKNNCTVLLHEYFYANSILYKPGYIKYANEQLKMHSKITNIRLTQCRNLEKTKIPAEIINILSPNKLSDINTIAQLHYLSFKQIDKNNYFGLAEFLLYDYDFLVSIIGILSEKFPQYFNTLFKNDIEYKLEKIENQFFYFVNKDDYEVIPLSQAVNLTIKFLEDTIFFCKNGIICVEGIMLNTNLNILLVTLIDLIKKGIINKHLNTNNEINVMHVAGIKMMDYMINNIELAEVNSRTINELFVTLKMRYKNFLPDTINFFLVPTFDAINKLIDVNPDKILEYEKYLSQGKFPFPIKKNYEIFHYDWMIKRFDILFPQSAMNLKISELRKMIN